MPGMGNPPMIYVGVSEYLLKKLSGLLRVGIPATQNRIDIPTRGEN